MVAVLEFGRGASVDNARENLIAMLHSRETVAQQGVPDETQLLQDILAANPDHALACHLYIHAMEAGPAPELAVPYADVLLNQIPGSGHLVHMPSHIYARVGRYTDAAESNRLAVAADRAYFAVAPQPALYAMYYGHNLHFLSFASMMEASRRSVGARSGYTAAAVPNLQGTVPSPPRRRRKEI